jgi:hypothetical protein
MKLFVTTILTSLMILMLAGCTQHGTQPRNDPNAAVVDRTDAVSSTGTGKAVLSLHKRKSFPEACTYGITLTNNLNEMITNISFRFAAHIKGGVFYKHVTRNFFRLRPTDHQYKEITFTGISCNEVDYLKVTDPGRCAVGKTMTKFSTGPGDCIRLVDIAPSPFVTLRQ